MLDLWLPMCRLEARRTHSRATGHRGSAPGSLFAPDNRLSASMVIHFVA